MFHRFNFTRQMTTVICLLSLVSCGGSRSGGDAAPATSSSASSTAFPSGLAVSSPTGQTSNGVRIRGKKGKEVRAAVDISASDSYAAKEAALAAMLAAATDADCDYVPNFAIASTNATCFGPNLTYTGHPDGAGANGSLPGGDLGLWDANEGATTEACAAAQLNAKVTGVASLVDSGVFAMASMMCIARRNSIAVPSSVGSSVDLTTLVAANYVTNSVGLTVTSAILSRDTDASDGRPVYITTLVGTVDASPTSEVNLRLKHVPESTSSNSTYRGKLSIKIVNNTGVNSGQNCVSGGTLGYVDAGSVSYEKSSATSLTYDLRSGKFCGSSADPYISTTNLTVDQTKNIVASTNGWADNFNWARFNMDPTTNAGNYYFAWQAGSNDRGSRVMNVNLTSSGSVLSGCAFFGYDDPISGGFTYDGTVNNMICNWTGPGNSPSNGQAYAQKQCFTNATGIFVASSNNITYAPTNSCTNSDAAFRFYKTGEASPGSAQLVTTADVGFLVNVTDVTATMTAVTAPTEVD